MLRANWLATDTGGVAFAAQEQRFESALAGNPLPQADADASRALLLELELVAGIEASAEDREQRRELQVARLAARMRGMATASPADEVATLLERWSALGAPADDALDARFRQALASALETLP